MTAVQLAGVVWVAFLAWWIQGVIRSIRRSRMWPRAEAQILRKRRFGTTLEVHFALPSGPKVTASFRVDPEGPPLVPGGTLVVVYDPNEPMRCEPAVSPREIVVSLVLGAAGLVGGVAMLVRG
ncbi:DUF3592 domain-containing protein [Neoroseomonas soli]|uniref:DUF3592 domain-containing protein n=1 Tax=Neoroseomonas soli TaxID=1081025 RepID=A0A9X9WVB4_9PROT|nr:DUF3592 domain-containing protein [Neoroseomonas soli]MBR0671093.1 hypothetical protein [Neoroseomonas soli]